MWTQILGHQKQIEQIKKTLAQGKIPHAYLFSGLEGIGKKMVAIGLAQVLLGEKQRVAKGIHPDCSLIGPSGKTIRIEVLRDLKQKAYLHPLEGAAKVFIIDNAEKMTTAGANALLKILEEPPAQTYLILITSAPSQILPTIRSRCQVLEFSPLNEELLLQKLKEMGKSEAESKTLTRIAQGSLQRALAFDPDFLSSTEEKLERLKQNPAPSKIIEMSESVAEEEESLPLFLNALGLLAYEQIGCCKTEEDLSRKTEDWLAIQKTKNQLDLYVNKRLLLENLLFKLCAHP